MPQSTIDEVFDTDPETFVNKIYDQEGTREFNEHYSMKDVDVGEWVWEGDTATRSVKFVVPFSKNIPQQILNAVKGCMPRSTSVEQITRVAEGKYLFTGKTTTENIPMSKHLLVSVCYNIQEESPGKTRVFGSINYHYTGNVLPQLVISTLGESIDAGLEEFASWAKGKI